MLDATPEWVRCSVALGREHGSGGVLEGNWRGQLGVFGQQAEELLAGLCAMHRFLVGHYDDYVDNNRAVASYASTMADRERDVIDQQATAFVSACGLGIDSLKALLQRQQMTAAADEDADVATSSTAGIRPDSQEAHEHAAITYLFERLRAVTALAEAMQSERRSLSALASGRFSSSLPSAGGFAVPSRETLRLALCASAEEDEEELLLREACPAAYAENWVSAAEPLPEETEERTQPLPPEASAPAAAAAARRGKAAAAGPPRRGAAAAAAAAAEAAATQASAAAAATYQQQRLALEDENRELVAALRSELDDVRQVEGRVSEISGLLGLFASKVVEQHDEVAHIYDSAVATNETVRRGGQHLDKAAERTGSFRRFYVAFMLAMSFALLFLHWFNP